MQALMRLGQDVSVAADVAVYRQLSDPHQHQSPQHTHAAAGGSGAALSDKRAAAWEMPLKARAGGALYYGCQVEGPPMSSIVTIYTK